MNKYEQIDIASARPIGNCALIIDTLCEMLKSCLATKELSKDVLEFCLTGIEAVKIMISTLEFNISPQKLNDEKFKLFFNTLGIKDGETLDVLYIVKVIQISISENSIISSNNLKY